MKLKKKYIHNNNRQIFRLIPTDTNKIIIEERDKDKKQAYFNCLHIESGKKILKNLQPDEKFWIGIEAVYNDVIFFHKFQKPDMPHHRGIIAYDIEKKKKIWEDTENTFLFIKDDKVYSFQQIFDGREFFTLNYSTGEVIEELGNDSSYINILREEVIESEDFSEYIFPAMFDSSNVINQDVNGQLNELRENHLISGKIEFALKDNLLMFNFHEIKADNSLDNKFKAVDLLKGKIIFEATLNFGTNAFAPDSFFVKDNLLFLLFERKKLGVYEIII